MVAAPGTRPLAGLEIVVVEGSHEESEIYRFVLAYFGATVTVARSADAAIRIFRNLRPDVVLVADMLLGATDARWLLREARANRVTAPFIAVSEDHSDLRTLTGEGFAAVLAKPVRHVDLLDAVRGVTDR